MTIGQRFDGLRKLNALRFRLRATSRSLLHFFTYFAFSALDFFSFWVTAVPRRIELTLQFRRAVE
jgi:hypothetical protein